MLNRKAINGLIEDLKALQDGQQDALGNLLLRAANVLTFLRVERHRLHGVLLELVEAHDEKPGGLTPAHWKKARKALKTGGFDFVKGKPQ